MTNINYNETIAAPATLIGTGAISIIRLSGPETFAAVGRTVAFKSGEPKDFNGYSVHFGTVYLTDGSPLDDVLVSFFKAPHSYTGEDSAEISFHASEYIAQQLMFLLSGAGVRTAEPGEFTLRAYMNGKMDLAQAESVADIISSHNAAAHRLAFNQLRGGFSKELMAMRSELLNMVSLMELELDFSEEDVEFADRSKLNQLLDNVLCHISKLTDSFRLGNAIRNGIPVSIVGAANSGKSTLLNALLGEDRAIVSDIPGTTRDTIEETFNINGTCFRLIDTAGIRDTSEKIEKIGIERSLKKLSEADIVIGVIDGNAPDEAIAEEAWFIVSKCDFSVQKLVIVLNKKDLFEAASAYQKNHNDSVLSDKGLTGVSPAQQKLAISSRPSKKDHFEADFALNKNVILFNNIVSGIDNKDYINSIKVLSISAAKGEGIDEIKKILSGFQPEILSGSDTNLVTNARHYDALVQASQYLENVRTGLASSLPTDLIAQDLRAAIDTLSSITGMSITTDELLGNIFQNFCVGK